MVYRRRPVRSAGCDGQHRAGNAIRAVVDDVIRKGVIRYHGRVCVDAEEVSRAARIGSGNLRYVVTDRLR